ncbi:MAG: hypothetical protein ACHQ3P_10710, partial [Candidatus Limnocylindrales bacterium]
MIHPTIAVCLPPDEASPVVAELDTAGFRTAVFDSAGGLEAMLSVPGDVVVAIIDCENDFDTSLNMYQLLKAQARPVPALMIVSARGLDRLAGSPATSSIDDEYVTRPYSAESIRWR